MKTLRLLLVPVISLFFVVQLDAQMWFDLGFKVGYGPTIMYNKNIFDDRTYDHELTAGSVLGGKLGVNFADHHAFTFDYTSSKSKQFFEFEFGGQNGARNEYEWDHSDILIMYRYSGNSAFVEIGPKFTSVKDVRQRFMASPEGDVSDLFEDNYTSVVFGFGSYLLGTDLFTMQLGVRLHYALGDFVNADGIAANYPTIERSYADYKDTKATAVQFSVEFNYAFGRFAKAACSHRWRLILFQ